MNVIEMDHVTVRRGDSVLLDEVSWTVGAGEQWVILGPNGAGKSTLLAVAATRLYPTSGVVTILEETIGEVDVAEVKPRIGVINAGIVAHIPRQETVRDVVVTAAWAVTGRWRESYEPMDEQRADFLLKQWGIDHLRDRAFHSLSDGERKRALIARSLMSDPELLLLDEPAAGLDLGAREELLARLSGLAREIWAPSSVLITHHVEEIPSGYSHGLLIRDGRVVAAGLLTQVLSDELLTATFGTNVRVQLDAGRWSARAV